MVTAKTLKPMYFSNSFSNCFSWQNFFSSIINCWQADRITTPAFKKPSNDLAPLPPWSWLGREVWAWAWAGGEAREGGGRWPCWGWGGSAYLISFGEVLGEFLMPPLRCFFFGDSVGGCSSSTANTGSVWDYEQFEGRLWNTGKISKDTHSRLSHSLERQGCL